MPAERPFNRYSLPGRLKPLKERRPEQPSTTLPSWETVIGKLDLITRNNQDDSDRKLIRKNRALLKDSYDAWFDVAAGLGRKKLNEFTRKYVTDDTSPDYNPERIDTLARFITTIRDSFPNIASKKR